MNSTNTIQPQDGNQIVIGENTGTIHIHNSSKQNQDVKQIGEHINNAFIRMETYFRENQFTIRKKRKSK